MCVFEGCWKLGYIMWQIMQSQARGIGSFRAMGHMEEAGYYSLEDRELLKCNVERFALWMDELAVCGK